MPRRDVRCVLVLGSGPIVIGQGCEFDYSGTQAIRALKEEGIRVVLLNSNPATIMTDPEFADATYIEPLTVDSCRAILQAEECDSILPTLGGQTALNLACDLADSGVLEDLDIQLLGVDLEAIMVAEDRRSFRTLALEAGCEVPGSTVVRTLDEAMTAVAELKLPLIVRPSFTLGGSGGGLARNMETFVDIVKDGLQRSPIGEVLLEESIEGWKEFELEIMRDCAGNNVVICSIENLDPMGTHTGDSITVAPVQTLSDRQYQRMRNAAFEIMNRVGIWGGANVQFALESSTGKMMVIEMNPRVSRSSALASKATGYPIAKVATRLALGYTLDELPNDIVGTIPASFEPALDYCVVKVPRWNFDKFSGASPELSSQMKSIGEVMALGRTFNEALQKAFRSLEAGWSGLEENGHRECSEALLAEKISVSNPERLLAIKAAYARGWSTNEVREKTDIDPWFLENVKRLADYEKKISEVVFPPERELLVEGKRLGFGDHQLAQIWNVKEDDVMALRRTLDIVPAVKMVDTCAGEFGAATPYYYLTYDDACEARSSSGRKVMILGSGPNRIGQGIEFDYCCVHASMELREMGVETIMVNCNPETVSTDFDVSDRLYFEPVTFEHVMTIIDKERPDGVIVQLGGQTPLKLLERLHEHGVPILGTTRESIDRAEDRKRCSELLSKLDIRQPASAFAESAEEAVSKGQRLGFPLLLRPPYVLGGMAMRVVFNEGELLDAVHHAIRSSEGRRLMLDRFVEGAIEVDVDAVCDGERVAVAGILEHIEEAGVHSGDSSCALPPVSLEDEIMARIENATMDIARELHVVGVMNVQFAVKDDTIYCIEINPRASRTMPFVSKATGVPWIKVALRAMMGEQIPKSLIHRAAPKHVSVKAPVMPFDRFPEVDSLLGPEMRATGEVMGIAPSFDEAYLKAQIASGHRLPATGGVFVSAANRHKREVIFPTKVLHQMGYEIVATTGTAKVLRSHGIPVRIVPKLRSGDYDIIHGIEHGDIVLVVNTPVGYASFEDERAIRTAANRKKVPCVTTMAGYRTLVLGLESLHGREFTVRSIQTYHKADQAVR